MKRAYRIRWRWRLITRPLTGLVDPRKARGIHHGLVVVLIAAVCAVAAGARSFVAVAERVADLPEDAAAALGTARRCPPESAIRRLLSRIEADRSTR